MLAIRFDRFGGPEVLAPVELPAPEAGPDQVLITVEAAGVNFADTHQTDGSLLSADRLPYVPGSEVVGRTADGRRVLARVSGGYAEQVVADASGVLEIPDELDAGRALALLMQGLTAWHLLRSAARLQPGETVVVHSAAGGVGSLAVQLAKEFGAGRVLAQASTPEKEQLALELGADGVASYPLEPGAAKADVVLDAVGGTLFDQALESLASFGRLVSYGNAARTGFTPVDPARLGRLNASVVGFWLRPTLARPGAVEGPLKELFDLTLRGRLRPVVHAESYPLAEARRAHEDLLARRTVGKVLLRP
ncbi:quinone oxidoreductase family protein [Streptomyces boluensis]|uniref:Zinc-binding dehydrogenase n=1 Tax=Streptomyces boluensis TaxID=1775135 RepID=A0A964UN16_9ACTN|nr:zinc-binding dehydrogenase [Streptomyces boluensis]NBE49937.1 zinc-binding dehydrogenase [Streptomyces boluensis]